MPKEGQVELMAMIYSDLIWKVVLNQYFSVKLKKLFSLLEVTVDTKFNFSEHINAM